MAIASLTHGVWGSTVIFPARCRALHCALSWALYSRLTVPSAGLCTPHDSPALLTLASRPPVFNAIGSSGEFQRGGRKVEEAFFECPSVCARMVRDQPSKLRGPQGCARLPLSAGPCVGKKAALANLLPLFGLELGTVRHPGPSCLLPSVLGKICLSVPPRPLGIRTPVSTHSPPRCP